jgi:predicted membrane protein
VSLQRYAIVLVLFYQKLNKMSEKGKDQFHPTRDGRVTTGVLILLIGVVLLLSKMNVGIPAWLVSWQMLLVVVGIFLGIRHKFKNPAWLIMVFVGSVFLIDQWSPDLHLGNYIGPIILIGLGLIFITRPRRRPKEALAAKQEWKRQIREIGRVDDINTTTNGEWLDSTSVFGGAKKVVLSKNFKGGDITCFMGGAEIDLTQADIQGKVVMDLTAVFGGIKLIIPPNWDLKIEINAVFGGVEDKRPLHLIKADPDKILVLDGAAVFGGIEINAY